MSFWSVDFYRRPCRDPRGQPQWELLIWSESLRYVAWCSQSEATAAWLTQQLTQALAESSNQKPEYLGAFRPQTLNLLEAAARSLDLPVRPDRRSSDLKAWLQERARTVYPHMEGYTQEPYAPLELQKPPPEPLPEKLWGESWQFAALSTAAIEAFRERPIPFLSLPNPLTLNPAAQIPGVVIYAGRQSLNLARWLAEASPVSLQYKTGEPDGLLLEAGLVERWVLATFEDSEVSTAGQRFEERKASTQGLHFLSILPDDSGMTCTGFWLLQAELPGQA
ncbi:Tab2 family RNA-binding protein [Leptolyngbya sp. FACHB-261]|uniref:Tab2 family RNA-binding protein n=1 Tax=Leptolyngbya sp. FACHB-261 TaxID=2692806 RepID=UPI001682B0A0|nr:Tab2 family RNA-binding protein [Leptolyngbya sp. FACHB-261]MBD2101146.1 Tab2/Atab2 family RNA-binding protein [Leptolyngbya sp. FACHB-261]